MTVEAVKSADHPHNRPQLPYSNDEHTAALVVLMNSCWAEQPTERPSFNDIAKNLRTLNDGELVLECVNFYLIYQQNAF